MGPIWVLYDLQIFKQSMLHWQSMICIKRGAILTLEGGSSVDCTVVDVACLCCHLSAQRWIVHSFSVVNKLIMKRTFRRSYHAMMDSHIRNLTSTLLHDSSNGCVTAILSFVYVHMPGDIDMAA